MTRAFAYTFYPGTCSVQQVTTTLPVVSTSQNGSGVSATRRDYFDSSGLLTWQMDERGFITKTTSSLSTGAPIQQIQDVDTATASGVPSGWTTPAGGGLNLVTDFESDERGRVTQTLGPSHSIDLNEGVAKRGRSTYPGVFGLARGQIEKWCRLRGLLQFLSVSRFRQTVFPQEG